VKRAHFLKSLLRRPPIKGDAVGSDKYSGAIATQPAVDEYSSSRPLPNNGKKLSDLFIPRRRPAVSRYVDETHAQGFRLPAFFFDYVMPFASEIDDGVDAAFLKLLNSFLIRLRATVKKFVDIAGIRDAWDVDFACESDLLRRRRSVVVGGAARSGGRQEQHQEISEDPHDFVATHLVRASQYLAGSGKSFASLYLLSHGTVKLVLVMTPLRNKL
jgi:hypothetical protein